MEEKQGELYPSGTTAGYVVTFDEEHEMCWFYSYLDRFTNDLPPIESNESSPRHFESR